MTPRDFAYWLQGYFEILDPKGSGAIFPLGTAQVECIRLHLGYVFKHLEPPKPAPGIQGWDPNAPFGPGVTYTMTRDPDGHTVAAIC